LTLQIKNWVGIQTVKPSFKLEFKLVFKLEFKLEF